MSKQPHEIIIVEEEEETTIEDEIHVIGEEKNIEIIEQNMEINGISISNGQIETSDSIELQSSESRNYVVLASQQANGENIQPETSKSKISFGVTIQKKSKIERTNLLAHEEEEPEVEPKRMKLTHFAEGVAAGHEEHKNEKKKTDYVIPMIVRNDWRIERLRTMEADGTITEEDRAKLAILVEAQGEAQIIAEESVSHKAIIYNTEEIEAAEDADYSKIPVEHFGLAILRGYGWKDGDGIGKTNKKAVPLKLPELRPKGLGLGAQLPNTTTKKVESDNPDEQINPLGLGSYVKVVNDSSIAKKNRYSNRYGIVRAMDEDNSSCMVELALDKSMVRISQFVLEAVSAREYKKNSKVLNNDNYERVKKDFDGDQNGRSLPQIQKTSSRNDFEESGKFKQIKDDYNSESISSKIWAVPNLRVRFVDKRYKDGAYFKQKMVVVEAADKYNVEVKDEKGKMHYNIKQTWLETVIPKGIGGHVRIVNGPYKGQVGLVAEKEDRKERLWVRLLNSDDLVKVSFDDACEWVGREEEFE